MAISVLAQKTPMVLNLMFTGIEIPSYQGMERFAARKAMVAEFERLGLLEEIKPHDLTVPCGDRGSVVIEPLYRPMVCSCSTFSETSR